MCTTTYKRNSIQEVEVHEPCIKSHRGNHQPYLIYIYIYIITLVSPSFTIWSWSKLFALADLAPEVMHRSGVDAVMDSPGEQRGGVPALRGPGLLRMFHEEKRHQKGIKKMEAWWKSDDITILGGFYMVLLCSSIRFYVLLCFGL